MFRNISYPRLYYFLFVGLAFSIPLYDRLVVFIILALILLWLVEGRFKAKLSRVLAEPRRKWMLAFSSVYLIYCFGLIYSDNLGFGFFDLQVKLSLLVFPLIFSTIEYEYFNRKRIELLFNSYIIGCVAITLFSLFLATLVYVNSGSFLAYYYDNLSAYQHPSYFSMNLNFGIAWILYMLFRRWNTLSFSRRVMMMIILPYFFLFIILLSSKAGIFSLLVVLLLGLLSFIIGKKNYVVGVTFLLLLAGAFAVSYHLFPSSYDRLSIARDYLDGTTPLDVTSEDGTNDRLLVWQSALEVSRQHLVFGVGTGDVKDALMEKYQEKQITAAITKRLNAHNQYLQTLIAVGIVGLCLLCISLLLPLYASVRGKNLLYLLFLVIILINFVGESMLERQAGVVFYSFFNGLLFFVHCCKNPDHPVSLIS